MRTLILESKGYKVTVFDYVAASETPKNIMVRAVKVGRSTDSHYEKPMEDYNKLHGLFNMQPMLVDYITCNS